MRPCNVRLVSNLIKSMIDAWTIKRWDLRGHASRLEAERSIMEIVTRGLIAPEESAMVLSAEANTLAGKTALVVNGGTLLGQAVCNALSARGVRVIVHIDRRSNGGRPSRQSASGPLCRPVSILKHPMPLAASQVNEIEKRFGPIDIYLHDLGIGTNEPPKQAQGREGGGAL